MRSSVNFFFSLSLKKPVSLDLHEFKANRVRNIGLTRTPKLEIKKRKKKEEKQKTRNFISCNTEMKSMQKRSIFEGQYRRICQVSTESKVRTTLCSTINTTEGKFCLATAPWRQFIAVCCNRKTCWFSLNFHLL